MKKLFREVEYIDGIQEFIEAEYITEPALERSANIFRLSGIPVIDSIRFSGDISLFKKQVYSEDDLVIEGAWMLFIEESTNKASILINPTSYTSIYTYTYITYKSKSKSKREGLYSVDYDKGILYTSTSVKNILLRYRSAIQYIEGQQMTQVSSSEYTPETLYSIPTDDNNRLTYVYQIKKNKEIIRSKEYISNAKLSYTALGDSYD